MDLTNLQNRLVEWLKSGPQHDVVLSSCVQLARNIDGYTFVARASDQQKARIEELLRNALLALDLRPPLDYVRLDRLTSLECQFLAERHLITSENAQANWIRGVAFDETERTGATVNDTDHVRIQVVHAGLDLQQAARQAHRFDDMLAQSVPYAFSDRYGYLTASPHDVGTGMRASVALHLPGVVMSREMDRVLELARGCNVRLRGVYGEGSHGSGDIYEVSNLVTLGPTEQELVHCVEHATTQVAAMERAARSNLHKGNAEEFLQRIARAMNLLNSAATITSQEALSFLSQVRMGVEMDLLASPPVEVLNDLFLLTLPAHLQTMEGGQFDAAVRNEMRADYLKSRLARY